MSAAVAYRSTRVLSSAPVELVVMLYERLLADLEGAALAIRAGDMESKAERLQRATNVIFELMASLDRDQGGEVSERLAALYTYMISRLGEVSRTRDPSIMDELAGHVRSLLSAWRSVAEGGATDADDSTAARAR